MLKVLKDIIDLTKNRVDEVDVDTQIDDIIRNAIIFAYMFKIPALDKLYSSSVVISINGLVELPEDLIRIETISPSLSDGEYRKGRTLFVKSTDGTAYSIVYEAKREVPTKDTDTIETTDELKYLMSTYACYVYNQYRKRSAVADMYLNEFNIGIQNIYNDSINNLENFPEVVEDYYSSSEVE